MGEDVYMISSPPRSCSISGCYSNSKWQPREMKVEESRTWARRNRKQNQTAGIRGQAEMQKGSEISMGSTWAGWDGGSKELGFPPSQETLVVHQYFQKELYSPNAGCNTAVSQSVVGGQAVKISFLYSLRWILQPTSEYREPSQHSVLPAFVPFDRINLHHFFHSSGKAKTKQFIFSHSVVY